MEKGKKVTEAELIKGGWLSKNSKYDGFEIWVNSLLVAYLYYNRKSGVIENVIYV